MSLSNESDEMHLAELLAAKTDAERLAIIQRRRDQWIDLFRAYLAPHPHRNSSMEESHLRVLRMGLERRLKELFADQAKIAMG